MSATTQPERLRMRCGNCGSEDVKADAFAVWNYELQMWEVQNTFDKGAFCEQCEGQTRIVEHDANAKPFNVTVNNMQGYGADFTTLDEALAYAVAESDKYDDEDDLDGITCEHSVTGELWNLTPNESGTPEWVPAHQ